MADLLKRIEARRLKSHVLRNNAASLQLHMRLGFDIEHESEIAIAFTADCVPLLRRLGTPRRLSATTQLPKGRGNV